MSIEAYVQGFEVKDYHTETLGTAIDEEIQARNGYRLALKSFLYIAAATAHIASFMYAKDLAGQEGSSRNQADGEVLSGQKDILCLVAPKDPAGNVAAASDIIAYQLSDGTWEFNIVASLAGSTITLTNNIEGVDAGAGARALLDEAKVMVFGVVGDGANLKLRLAASVTTERKDLAVIHPFVGEPFYLSIDNVTAAGFLDSLIMAHINK